MTDAEIIAEIKRAEGWPTFTQDPVDLGGPTKGGITLDTLRAWRRTPALTVADLQALDETEADAIYQFMFLQPFAAVPGESLRHLLIDLGVLRGPKKAAIMLQEIIGALPADGWIGALTLAALVPLQQHALVLLVGARLTHIEGRIRENPSQAKYRNGWRARALAFLPKGTP